MLAQAKAWNDSGQTDTTGLYVHVPFCPTVCEFCAFYQEKPEKGAIGQYLVSVQNEARRWPKAQGTVSTVFWGGGTPGLLRAHDLARLAETTRTLTDNAVREWTVELAPSTVKPDKLAVLLDAGVTRVSLGVQSFNPSMLDRLGRQHSRKQVDTALELLQSAGFASVNVDLIFAAPGQELEQWESDLREAARRDVDHISTYCLTFEEDTKLWARLAQGQLRRDIDTEARFYQVIPEVLGENHYEQYEISNFARPGHRCIHNINTWRMGEWLGLGPSAASQYAGRRWRNVADLHRWNEGLAADEPAIEEVVKLDGDLLASDSIVFGLRMNEGVDLNAVRTRYQPHALPPESFWERLIAEGLLTRQGTRIRLTPAGRLLADAVGAAVLDAWC